MDAGFLLRIKTSAPVSAGISKLEKKVYRGVVRGSEPAAYSMSLWTPINFQVISAGHLT